MNEKYPIVTDIVPSQKTATILKNLLFSQNGILTSHLSYMYQSWIIAPQDKATGDFLQKLSDNNGQILNSLGSIVVAFGGNPNFATQNKNWSSQYLILSPNKQNFVRSAILMESRAIKDFDYAIENVDNASLKSLLSVLRNEKQVVVQDLQKIIV